jgi:chemotaxis protein methyltransferase WspC
MGLNVASIGSAAIARAVQERLAICQLDDPRAYLERVRASPAELQALIETVVVPETWFFRDRHSFTTLARLAVHEWIPSHPEGVLSVLSLPCSTGEEPYSIAMALLDAGFPADRFHVDAVDISDRSLVLGIRAVYGRNSFRGDDLRFRDRHFDATMEGYQLKETVRRQVRFRQGNMFAADFLPGSGIYDVIFCRNVLIYFDRPTQDRALGVLNRLLEASGVLFVAPAETSLPANHGLVSTQEPLAFAFRRAAAFPTPSKRQRRVAPLSPAPSPRPPVAPAELRRSAPPIRPGGPDRATPRDRGTPPIDPAVDLDETTRLANQGRFVEAATRCDEHLRRFGPSAPLFYLIGLVRDATGHAPEAAASYRKALYLDPNHYDTQIHLALLMEKQGDIAGAQVLRKRAGRLEQKNAGQKKAASHE